MTRLYCRNIVKQLNNQSYQSFIHDPNWSYIYMYEQTLKL